MDKCLPTPYSWVPKTQIRLQGKSRLLCNLVRLFPCEVLLYCKHRADNAFIREMAAAMRFHNTHDFRCIVTYIWSCVSTLFLIFFEKNLVLRLKQCCVILEKCVHRPALLRQIFCGHWRTWFKYVGLHTSNHMEPLAGVYRWKKCVVVTLFIEVDGFLFS